VASGRERQAAAAGGRSPGTLSIYSDARRMTTRPGFMLVAGKKHQPAGWCLAMRIAPADRKDDQ
jgi:hypothetical protein